MVIVPVAFALLSTMPRPAVPSRPVLHGAIVAAAHDSNLRLERMPQHRRGELYRLSPRTGRRVAFVIMGTAAGFMGSLIVGAAANPECGPSMPIVVGATIGGGALGWLLAGQ